MHEIRTPLKVAVLGVGFMGQHHARIYRSLPQAQLVAVADTDSTRAHAVARSCECAAYTNSLELLDRHPDLDAISIAVPTSSHTEVALPALARRIPCLIEKPLAPSLLEAERLAAAAQSSRTIVQVGHIERYNPAIMAVARLGLQPLFIKVDRVSPMPFRSLDVDVVLDIMIHDLDLVLMFYKDYPMPASIDALGVNLGNSPIHLAQARISFDSGHLADLTASRIARQSKRKIRIFTNDAYVSIDCTTPQATVLRMSDYLRALEVVQTTLDQGTSPSEDDLLASVKVDNLLSTVAIDKDFQLREELVDFLTTIKNQTKPLVDVSAGLRAVELAELVKHNMRRVDASNPHSIYSKIIL